MLKSLMKLKKLVLPMYALSETEELIRDVIVGMVRNEDTDVMSAPISGSYYISNERLHYYIKIDEFSITITNHKFTFNEGITSKFGNIIIGIVRSAMEINRKQFEATVFVNKLQLLKNIKDSL